MQSAGNTTSLVNCTVGTVGGRRLVHCISSYDRAVLVAQTSRGCSVCVE